MTPEKLAEQYAIAGAVVAQWPAWKQNLLVDSGKATCPPRAPVDNFARAPEKPMDTTTINAILDILDSLDKRIDEATSDGGYKGSSWASDKIARLRDSLPRSHT